MQTPTNAADVAEYLVWLAANERQEDPDYLTPLKLQKLLYYVQGWSYAEWGRPFFKEVIQAWRNGPVVPDVYKKYKDRERLPIAPEGLAGSKAPGRMNEEERALVRGVWDAYKQYSAYGLADIAEREKPYLESYKPNSVGWCDNEIRQDQIKSAFAGRADVSVGRLHSKRDKLREIATANARAMVGRDVF